MTDSDEYFGPPTEGEGDSAELVISHCSAMKSAMMRLARDIADKAAAKYTVMQPDNREWAIFEGSLKEAIEALYSDDVRQARRTLERYDAAEARKYPPFTPRVL